MNSRESERALDLRPKPHHLVAAISAFLVSLVFHIVIWNKLPTLPLRAIHAERQKEYHPIHLENVFNVPPPRREEKTSSDDRHRPENPKKLSDLLGAPAPLPELAADAIRVPAPPDIKSPPNALAPAKGGPLSAPDRSRWEPRQEILQVEQTIVKDEVAALPRRFEPSVPRVANAPDWVSSIELPMGGPGKGIAPASGSGAAAGYTLTSPNGVEGGTGSGISTQAGGTDSSAKLFPGATDLFNEKPREISDTKAVEKHLALSMFVYRPPGEGGAGYFELQIRRGGEESLPVLPKDVLFIQDCSESITPGKLSECKEGLRRWLVALGPQDRFEIITFRESVSRCFSRWVSVSDQSIKQGLAFIDSMRSVGNTDVYASLDAARKMRQGDDRPIIGVLITDGRPTAGVTGSSDIIERFTKQNSGAVPVFCLGAGKKVNHFLIDLLSYRNRGESTFVPDPADLPAALQKKAGELARPVLHDLSYHMTGFDVSQIYPQSLTHLFLDRPLVIYGRIAPGEQNAIIQIVGRAGGEKLDMMFNLDVAKAAPGSAMIREKWAWQKVYGLIGNYIQSQSPALLSAIRSHAIQYGLAVPYGYGEGVPAD